MTKSRLGSLLAVAVLSVGSVSPLRPTATVLPELARRTANGAPTAAISASTRYAPLDQINADNFNKLEVAWRFKTDALGPAARVQPAVHAADGRRRALHDRRHPPRGRGARRRDRRDAVDAQPRTKASAARRRRGSCRAAVWRTGPTAREARILYVTPGYQLVALDAKTGAPDAGLRQERHRRSEAGRRSGDRSGDRRDRSARGADRSPSDVVIVGAAHLPGGIPKSSEQRQRVRARLRRAHRQAAVDLPHDSAGRASSGIDTWEGTRCGLHRATPASGRR